MRACAELPARAIVACVGPGGGGAVRRLECGCQGDGVDRPQLVQRDAKRPLCRVPGWRCCWDDPFLHLLAIPVHSMCSSARKILHSEPSACRLVRATCYKRNAWVLPSICVHLASARHLPACLPPFHPVPNGRTWNAHTSKETQNAGFTGRCGQWQCACLQLTR